MINTAGSFSWQAFNNRLNAQKWSVYVMVISLACFICFFNLGKQQLNNWDESLYGVNAYEMQQKGDFLNPYYKGKPDEWNVKPPLSTNFIIQSQRVFGFNEFGLRFPSALSACLLLLILFRFLITEWDILSAVVVTSMLLGTTALIGTHSGRTGDPDAIFTLFTTLGCLSFYRFSEYGKTSSLLAVPIWFGLAFYTKSTAVLLFVPGMILYLVLSKKFMTVVKQPRVWLALLIFSFFPVSWILVSTLYGIEFSDSKFGGTSGWTNNLIYDTLHRFTGSGEFAQIEKKHDFILTFLDSCFNLWYFPFYATLLFLFVSRFRGPNKSSVNPSLVNLSLAFLIPYLTLLQVSANVNGWYLVPMTPFIAIITNHGIKHVSGHFRFVLPLVLVLALFTIGRQINGLANYDNSLAEFYNSLDLIVGQQCLFIDEHLQPNETLYAQWHSDCQKFGTLENFIESKNQPGLVLTNQPTTMAHEVLASYESLKLISIE